MDGSGAQRFDLGVGQGGCEARRLGKNSSKRGKN